MRTFVIAAAAVIVLASGSVALASGDPTQASGRTDADHKITVTGKTTQLNLLDLGDQGFTLGDQIAFSDDLLSNPSGKPAGVDGGACTLIRVTDADAQTGTVQCLITYSLKGGQVTTQGLLTLTNGGFLGTQAAAITGGTGLYRNAGGESTLEFIRPGELNITLRILS
jgi:allene oxide cyclase-like protein